MNSLHLPHRYAAIRGLLDFKRHTFRATESGKPTFTHKDETVFVDAAVHGENLQYLKKFTSEEIQV